MSIQSEINRLTQNISAAFAAVGNKGGTVPTSKTSGNLATAINSIPEATDPILQSKTVSPSTSKQTVTPDSGYDGLSSVTVNAMTTATQATPSISVSTSGLITASATQTAGYVTSGTKSTMKQLTTQAAQTITPGNYNKTIASGRYLTGTQTIEGDSNLVPENIKKGVSIFDVTGTLEVGGGSGGGSGVISAVATGTYTPARDISYGVEIKHGLRVTPNFCIWMAENDFSDITDVSAVVVGAMVAKPMLYSASSGMTLPCQYFLRGYDASGTVNGTTSYKDDYFMTDTIVTILGNNTYKLKSGWTYRWAAGVINA